MAHPSAAWGIEIGQYAIKAVRLERDGDDAVVSDFVVVPHRKVLTTPDINPEEVTRLSLGQLISQKNLEGEHLVISVPGHSAFARFAKLPPVEPKNLPDIVKFEAVQQIPFPIEQVEWDYEAFVAPDSPEVEVGIFAITRERVNERLDVYGEVGLSPECLTLGPVALFNAMFFDRGLAEDKRPLVFIDVGTQATDVIIAEGSKCWIRTFPLGGHHFTEAVAEAFKIAYGKAERLKLEAASSKYAKQIMQAMRPVFADLLQELQRSLSFASQSGDAAEMIGIGSTFKIPGLRKFIGQQLQVNVSRLDEFQRISVTGREAASFAENCVNMASAYGLALQGIGMAQIDINLVPTSVLREQLWHAKTRWFVTAAGIIIAGSAITLLGPFLEDRKMSGDGPPSSVTQVIDRGERLKREYSQAEQQGRIGTEAANLVSLLDYRDVWPYLVNDAADALAAGGPDDRLMTLADFLQRYPEVPGRELIQLHHLGGDLITQEPGKPARIAVRMEVELSHANPIKFLQDRVGAWLKDNAVPEGARAGVPYVIVASSISCNPNELRTNDEPEAASERGGSGGRSGGGSGAGGRSGSGGGASGGGTQSRTSGGGGGGRSSGGGPPRSGGSGSSSPPSADPPPDPEVDLVESRPVSAGSMNDLAPLPRRPEEQLHPPGTSWFQAVVTFEVEVLQQPAKPAASQADASGTGATP